MCVEHAGMCWWSPAVARKVLGFMLTVDRKKKVITESRIHEKDTGSAEIQIALLTERINELSSHFKAHNKDFSSRRGLLKYLTRTDPQRYQAIITRLGLRK